MTQQKKPITIAALLTCFNRKGKTLECLKSLYQQSLQDNIQLDIYLVDDGSTDGTSEAVCASFPKAHIIKGTGSLYWNGGMRLAWESALEASRSNDFYLWVNDDCALYSHAISDLYQTFEKILNDGNKVGAVVGTMLDPETKQPTYGGRQSVSKLNPIKLGNVVNSADKPLQCDGVNGNLVLVPKASVDAIGILSKNYTHGIGDNDYGFRLNKAGLPCWVAPGPQGECPRNTIDGTFQDKSLPIHERLQKMKNPAQLAPAKERLFFIRSHGGPLWPIYWIRTWLRGKFPILWILLK